MFKPAKALTVMPATSFERLLKSSRIAITTIGRDDFRPDRSIRIAPSLNRNRLDGKVKGSGGSNAGGSSPLKPIKLSQKLAKRTPMKPRLSIRSKAFAGAPMAFDARQRAVVKVHYFNHAGGGAALKAHARYVARDAAARDDLRAATPAEEKSEGRETAPEAEARTRARAHAAYLSKAGERVVFYDALAEGVDGTARAEAWAQSDRRHFRVVLSPENGVRLADLPAYTREVMARAGATLGTKLNWVAVDHHDTDNPHTHVIIRGRRANGQDLVLPRDFIRHGFRSIARDVATEWLGPRSPADERLALDREVGRHAPTRLDRMIEAQLPENRTIHVARLEAANGDPSTTLALKGRARELERMGLAREVKRNVFAFEPDWRDRLQAMELHLDIRKRIVQERALRQGMTSPRAIEKLTRGLIDR